MAHRATRSEILTTLQRARATRSLVAAGVGMGLSAGAAAQAGADLIVAYHSAPLRLRGLPSVSGALPVADANHDTLAILPEVVRCAADRPVIATVFASDPRLAFDAHLARLASLGAAGVMNAPPITLLEPALRCDLDSAGLGFERELELTSRARERGLLTVMYAFDAAQAADLIGAGVDVLVLHLGITRPDRDAAPTAGLVAFTAALDAHPEIVYLVHGGPVSTPQDVSRIQDEHPRVDGFFGVSSIERLPITAAVSRAVQAFAYDRNPGGRHED